MQPSKRGGYPLNEALQIHHVRTGGRQSRGLHPPSILHNNPVRRSELCNPLLLHFWLQKRGLLFYRRDRLRSLPVGHVIYRPPFPPHDAISSARLRAAEYGKMIPLFPETGIDIYRE